MNAFRQLLKASGAHPPVGTWISTASPIVAEAMGHAGFDWGVVDMEHAPLDVMGVVHLLQALSGTKMLPVVRVPWNDAVMVKRVLDAGATTVMFPFVQGADEARRAVAATRYPPEGVRGMAGLSRATRFGTIANYFRSANQSIGVIVQIETPQAIEQIDAIAGVDGVDALFIGPADLSAAMGHIGELTHPAVVGLMSRAVQRCKALGRPVGTLGANPEAVAQYRAIGFDYVAVSSDIGFMMRGAQAAIAALRTRDTEHVHTLASGTQPSTT
ncbi:MAG TPA: HpcH/HpaI aldolase/citrate lyase family protein [Albitalea sp.]|uniref:HpcH/HpaI aldolase family protein n=1 Tax=Piscinibacter sp. TaxID=1903157 RepID=UPI002ED117D3